MEIPLTFKLVSGAVLLLILIGDLLMVVKRPHVPSLKECGLWVGFYVSLALVFAGVLWALGDAQHAGQFVTGWLMEYSLSIDNLFVFVLIMGAFAVPKRYQQEVLMVGIIIALIARGIFILVGAAVIERFVEVFFLFGAFLLFIAWKQAFSEEDEGDAENGLIKFLKKRINVTEEYHGNKLRVDIDGTRFWTPMFIVFIAIGSTDVMFALDSIPAIFGVTQDAFLVFTANVFALMGLRQLYFLLGGLVDRLVYLHYGIAAILGFIGVKLLLHALHASEWVPFRAHVPEIPIWMSLTFIVLAMVVATVASLMKMRQEPDRVQLGPVADDSADEDSHKHS
ncbi:TerC/Alx family metal homeostasis membrane protein [Brevibacterium litoralis]|uniref:TerC/Alx family metal homeostasis membrane protein n=1 Tax=Brevibacterium litoralis TaxID=3138935 RepID=UPI0032ECBD52